MLSVGLIHINTPVNFGEVNTGKNKIIHSELHAFEKHYDKSALSVKMVLAGVERYRVNQRRFDLTSGQFLIVNEKQELNIAFSEKQKSEGFCFYLDETFLKQRLILAENGEEFGLDNPFCIPDRDFSFLAIKQHTNTSVFGKFLMALAHQIKTELNFILDEGFFIDFADQLLHHQKTISNQINRLPNIKLPTRKELYSRANLARDYIEGHAYSSKIDIKSIALNSAMSEVQLHRTFKCVFGMSPHQYILEKKMLKAEEMLSAKHQTCSEVATSLGFADLQSFSKFFKKRFGLSPKKFQNSI